MARGVNKVILVATLGQDPEARNTPNGDTIVNISCATSEKWKDKQTGQFQERTEWHRVVFFKRLAEIAREYLHKGSKVYIEGSLKTRKWQNSQGVDMYTTEIIARELQLLDAKPQTQQEPRYQTNNQNNHNNQQQNTTQQRTPPPPELDPYSDDIPF